MSIYFPDIVSGGFATVHPNNKLSINAIEAYELDQFSPEVSIFTMKDCIKCNADSLPLSFFSQAVRSSLAEAQRVASGAGSPEAKAEADIEVEVYTALQAALAK